jgi:hypothetical protein
MDDVVADLKVMKIKQWMEETKDREQWRLVVEETNARPGLWRREDGWMDIEATRKVTVFFKHTVEYLFCFIQKLVYLRILPFLFK